MKIGLGGTKNMTDILELANYEIYEFCTLNRKTGKTDFYKEKKKTSGFTGLYFKSEDIFLLYTHLKMDH